MRVSRPTSDVLAGVEDSSISGLVVEYIVAIDVTRVRLPADALLSYAVRRILYAQWCFNEQACSCSAGISRHPDFNHP